MNSKSDSIWKNI